MNLNVAAFWLLGVNCCVLDAVYLIIHLKLCSICLLTY